MFIDVQQNSEDWYNLRLGKITSSNFSKIMANDGKGFGNPAIEYAEKLALEYVTGKRDTVSSYKSFYMERGIELEPVAVDLYEIETLYSTSNGGFHVIHQHSEINLGDSPDRNVGKDGSLEIKTVIAHTQWKRIKKGGFDTAYKWQIHGHIWLGEKKWCDFVSYCPEMPERKRLYIFRVERDEEMIDKMKKRIEEFKQVVFDHIKLLTA